MKRFLVLSAVLLLVTANGVFAETPVKTFRQLDRATAEQAFEQLMKNAQKGLLAPNAVVQSKFAAIEDIYLRVSPDTGVGGQDSTDAGRQDSQPANIPITNGMRVWFELPDGKLINPSVYHFAPQEEFFVHVEAAVPVFVALYQNFPHDKGKEPKLVHPDQKFPNSFRILNPAKSTKLPIKFAMDNGDEAEYMTVVVVRADWVGIAEDVPTAAITAVDLAKADSPERVYQRIPKGTADISNPAVLTKFMAISKQVDWTSDLTWEEIESKPKEKVEVVSNWKNDTDNRGVPQAEVIPKPEAAQTVQFVCVNYRLPSPEWNGTADDVREVANYLFSNTGVGRLQIVLNKKVEHVAP